MASDDERADLAALRELEEVLRLLEAELASWRRRALSAEAGVADSAGSGGGSGGGRAEEAPARVRELEAAYRGLEQRLSLVRSRVGELVDRLKFLEQQSGNEGADR
ncbi:MAG: hypothetical protein HY705_07655 [Gemmatimonadetes bacterium]|nr:hypothetical protein [Gemmatimonadota bacterium]